MKNRSNQPSAQVFTEKVNVLIRVHDFQKLSLLEAAIYSLAKQSYPLVEPVLLLQNPSLTERRTIEELLKRVFVPQRSQAVGYEILECQIPPGQDGRTQMLNLGLRETFGRYLAFLDYDDLVEPEIYETLILSLGESHAAFSCAGCKLDYIRFDGNRWITTKSLLPFAWGRGLPHLYKENFIPLHSFVIDRNKVLASDLVFNEDMVLLEDYEFILRLASKYVFDFSKLDKILSHYRARHDGSNTNPTLKAKLSSSEAEKLELAQAQISALKAKLPARMSIAEVSDLVPERVKGSFVKRLIKGSLSPLIGDNPKIQKRLSGWARQAGIKESKI
jgi:hypothetical protein